MVDKRAGLAENPIRMIRKELKRNQKDFAKDCGIHVSGLYLLECGAYSHIFPSVLGRLESLGFSRGQVEKDYRQFIKKQREKERDTKVWLSISLDSPNLLLNPFSTFRLKADQSRTSFCKRLCIQPALVYRLEQGNFKNMPASVEIALTEVGVPTVVLAQLNEQMEEYYYGKQAVKLA